MVFASSLEVARLVVVLLFAAMFGSLGALWELVWWRSRDGASWPLMLVVLTRSATALAGGGLLIGAFLARSALLAYAAGGVLVLRAAVDALLARHVPEREELEREDPSRVAAARALERRRLRWLIAAAVANGAVAAVLITWGVPPPYAALAGCLTGAAAAVLTVRGTRDRST